MIATTATKVPIAIPIAIVTRILIIMSATTAAITINLFDKIHVASMTVTVTMFITTSTTATIATSITMATAAIIIQRPQ